MLHCIGWAEKPTRLNSLVNPTEFFLQGDQNYINCTFLQFLQYINYTTLQCPWAIFNSLHSNCD